MNHCDRGEIIEQLTPPSPLFSFFPPPPRVTETYVDYYYECTLSWAIQVTPGTEFNENSSLKFSENHSKFLVIKSINDGAPPPEAPFPQIRKIDPIDLDLSYLVSRVVKMGPNFDLVESLSGKV